MSIIERDQLWETKKEWMNIGLSLDADGKVKLDVIKYKPLMTSFGMPGFDEQMKFHGKLTKMQARICECLRELEKNQE